MSWWEKLIELIERLLGARPIEEDEWVKQVKQEKQMMKARLELLIGEVKRKAKEAIKKAEEIKDFASYHGWGYMGFKPETFKAGFFYNTGCPDDMPRIVPDLTMSQYYCKEMDNPIDGCSLYWYIGRAKAEASNALEKVKGLRKWQSVWAAVRRAEEALRDAEKANAWADKGLEMMKKYWETSVCLKKKKKEEKKEKKEKPKKESPPPSKYTVQRFIIKGKGRIELTWGHNNRALIVTTREVGIEKGEKVTMKCWPSATITVRRVIWKVGEYVTSEPIDVIEGEELTFVADEDYCFDVKFKETPKPREERKEKEYEYPSKRMSKEIKFRIYLTIDGRKSFGVFGNDSVGFMHGELIEKSREKIKYKEGKAKLEALYWLSGSEPFTVELLDKEKTIISKEAPFETNIAFDKGDHKLTLVIRDKRNPKCGHVIHLKKFIVE